ncbi:MAG: sialate O-acetylesterase [Verrucomicrobiota bacterium]
MQSAQPSETFTIGGILWTQGELDARQMMSSNDYASELTTSITDMRATYGSDLPFFFSRLSDGQTDLPATDLSNIRAAQEFVDANVTNTYLINTDGFAMSSDNLHFNAVGYDVLGQAFGQSVIDAGVVTAIPEPGTYALLLLSGVILGFCTRRRECQIVKTK